MTPYDSLSVSPPRLRRGDTIGLVTPSAPAAGLYPRRFERGVAQLKSLGFNVKQSRHCTTVQGPVAASALERAEDLNEFFADPSVNAIIATLGGGGAQEILPHLDWNTISANPKIFCGYSDTTILLQAVHKLAGFTTYYGPSLMTEFAEFPAIPDYSKNMFLRAVGSDEDIQITPLEKLLSKKIAWSSPDEAKRQRQPLRVSRGVAVRGGTATGPLTGGCIESINALRGTSYWPDLDGRILFLETANHEFDRASLADSLKGYDKEGVWRQISGLIFGQKKWKPIELDGVANLLRHATRDRQIPAAIGIPVGHVSPMATIPIGSLGTLEAHELRLTVKAARSDESSATA
jgi:muramoyltetrapeptide carboxypeptidase